MTTDPTTAPTPPSNTPASPDNGVRAVMIGLGTIVIFLVGVGAVPEPISKYISYAPIYMAPSIVAFARSMPNRWNIFVINAMAIATTQPMMVQPVPSVRHQGRTPVAVVSTVSTNPSPADPPAVDETTGPTAGERLALLVELLDHGLITGAEYEAKRAAIVDEL